MPKKIQTNFAKLSKSCSTQEFYYNRLFLCCQYSFAKFRILWELFLEFFL